MKTPKLEIAAVMLEIHKDAIDNALTDILGVESLADARPRQIFEQRNTAIKHVKNTLTDLEKKRVNEIAEERRERGNPAEKQRQ